MLNSYIYGFCEICTDSWNGWSYHNLHDKCKQISQTMWSLKTPDKQNILGKGFFMWTFAFGDHVVYKEVSKTNHSGCKGFFGVNGEWNCEESL